MNCHYSINQYLFNDTINAKGSLFLLGKYNFRNGRIAFGDLHAKNGTRI